MLLEEFDAEKYERTLRSVGWEKGRKEGAEKGFRCSIEIMQETNFTRDSAKKKLIEKYFLTEEEAERKILRYWK